MNRKNFFQFFLYSLFCNFGTVAIHCQDQIFKRNTIQKIVTYNHIVTKLKEILAGSKMDKACELAEKYKGRDSYSEIYKAIKKVSESL